ncbi:centrosomal protein of 72 kDa isoform X2 [Esox lucius]|uniref:centrosomal protein of 72 kDa isoform X2 n=1 Tax=Esox lucius TaxID=8010 RepID=UPI0014772CC5|nr:centrosomal protein of 72 kDa isoform X2 [Esox lucius]
MATADVRSLILPGSYKEKIRHLGISLKNFVRLKTLDLSCNALISIEGVQHLEKLERLNLYYNHIPSIQEVKVICKLTTLRELDLRLNPLAKTDPQYRLYLVHTLPSLRKLDDCPVRDTERRLSLMHFSSDSTTGPQLTSSMRSEKSDQRGSDLRMASVNRLTKKLSILDDSDDILLNLVAKSNWGQSETQILTGSFHKDAESQLYHQIKDYSRHTQSPGPHLKEESLRRRSPALSLKTSEGPRVTFNPTVEKHSTARSGEERRKLPKQLRVPAKGHFTPHPGLGVQPDCPLANIRPPSPRRPCPTTSDASNPVLNPPRLSSNPILHPPRLSCNNVQRTAGGSALPQKGSYRKPMEAMLGLVERHWTGKSPLNHDLNFLSQAVQILSMMEHELSGREDEVRSLRCNVRELKEQAEIQSQDHRTETHGLTAQLEEAHSAVDSLNEHLRVALEENVNLQKQLIELEHQHLNSMMSSSPDTVIGLSGNQEEVEELIKEVAGLRLEVQWGESQGAG